MSIHFPQTRDSEIGTIVGIDPGTNTLGFSVLHYSLKTFEVLSVEAMSFKSEKMIDHDTFIPITHNERIAKIIAQRDNLVKQFNYYKPNAIACEIPFMNKLFPGAYGPLVEIVFAIRMAAIEYNPSIKFITLEPSIIKKAVGANAIGKNKEEIKVALIQNKELCPNELTSLSDVDEHAIDATAVAYTHLLKIRKEL